MAWSFVFSCKWVQRYTRTRACIFLSFLNSRFTIKSYASMWHGVVGLLSSNLIAKYRYIYPSIIGKGPISQNSWRKNSFINSHETIYYYGSDIKPAYNDSNTARHSVISLVPWDFCCFLKIRKEAWSLQNGETFWPRQFKALLFFFFLVVRVRVSEVAEFAVPRSALC